MGSGMYSEFRDLPKFIFGSLCLSFGCGFITHKYIYPKFIKLIK